MLTQTVFAITREGGTFLRENTSNSSVWVDKIEDAYVCATYIEAETMIDRINLPGFYQIQKLFARVPE